MMEKDKPRWRRGPILLSWVLIWFGTILVANDDSTATTAGVVLWIGGIVLQYGFGFIWLTGRPSSSETADQSAAARV